MKRTFCLILAILSTAFFSGCEGIVEIDNRAIIQLVGVDFVDNMYSVSMQMYAPNGEKIADSGNIVVNTVVGVGKSIGEAINNVEYKQGRKAFLGHTYVLVLGESMLNTDIQSALRVFADDEAIYPGMNVLMAKGSAFDVVNLQIPMGMISARTLDRILIASEDSGHAKSSNLAQSISMLNSKSGATTFPLVEIIKTKDETQGNGDGEENQEIEMISLGETIIVKKDKSYQILDTEQTAGLNWLTDNIKSTVYSCEIDSRQVAVFITKAKTTIKPKIIGDKVVLNTQIDIEFKTSDEASVSLENKEYLQKIQNVISQKIISQCENCLQKVVVQNNIDVLNIARYLKVYQPKYFRNNSQDINNIMANVSYDISVKCKFDI